MTSQLSPPLQSTQRARFALVLAVILLPLMVTNESFWVDEGTTGLYAIQPNWEAWVHHLTNDHNADCQMPLTMLTSWVVGQTVGATEWLLRAQNFFFAGIVLFIMYAIGRRSEMPWLPLLLAIQPFFWFYMDEARPYLAQMAGGALLAWVTAILAYKPKMPGGWLLPFSLAAIALFSTSMLSAVAIASTFLACFLLGGPPPLSSIKRQMILLFIVWSLMGLLFLYYVWSVFRGAQGARIWAMDWRATAFIGYEVTGCLGLGPSLQDLRIATEAGELTTLLASFLLPGLLLCSLLVLAVSYYYGWSSKSLSEQKHVRLCLLTVSIVFTIMIVVSVIIHKPLWARHLSPRFVFLTCLEGYFLRSAFLSRSNLLKFVAVVFICLLIFSSLAIRFSARFEKDDYRSAAETAKAALARGGQVWWSAGEYTAVYYGVPLNFSDIPSANTARILHQIPTNQICSLPHPSLIITSRPEVFDSGQTVANYLRRNRYFIIDKPYNFIIYGYGS